MNLTQKPHVSRAPLPMGARVMAVFTCFETGARNLTRLTSTLGFMWLTMLLALALLDYLTRVNLPW